MITKKLVLFLLTSILWCLLVWPLDPATGQLKLETIGIGLLVAAVVTAVMREFSIQNFLRFINPVRYFWLAVYIMVFTASMVRANLDVAYRILHPAMPIHPGIVRIKSRLKSASALTALANSITLTPGTLTVDATAEGVLYVHWMNVTSLDSEEAKKKIIGRYEWFIHKIFE